VKAGETFACAQLRIEFRFRFAPAPGQRTLAGKGCKNGPIKRVMGDGAAFGFGRFFTLLKPMSTSKILVFSFAMTVLSVPTAAQVAKVYPIDEAVRDPEFFAFRARLMVALQRKDVTYLYSILAANILNSFGGDGGVEEFKARWKAEEPRSEVWNILTEILALGGQFRPPDEWSEGARTFVAPYTFSVQPSAGEDPFPYGVVVGRGVRVRQEPTATATILANLSFDVIRVTDWAPKSKPEDVRANSWVAVELADGRPGFVASEFIRSRIGYRTIFIRQNGRWMLRALVAGD
jgi:hypothetical protein